MNETNEVRVYSWGSGCDPDGNQTVVNIYRTAAGFEESFRSINYSQSYDRPRMLPLTREEAAARIAVMEECAPEDVEDYLDALKDVPEVMPDTSD